MNAPVTSKIINEVKKKNFGSFLEIAKLANTSKQYISSLAHGKKHAGKFIIAKLLKYNVITIEEAMQLFEEGVLTRKRKKPCSAKDAISIKIEVINVTLITLLQIDQLNEQNINRIYDAVYKVTIKQ